MVSSTVSHTPAAPAATATCCAVVVNYCCAPATVACVESLCEHAPDLAILVVENGSEDGSLQQLRRNLPGVERCELLVALANLGFGAGCNLGVERVLARYPKLQSVLLINPDTVVTPGFLDELSATARRHPQAGIVGGTIHSIDGSRIWYENGRYRPWTLTRSHVPAPAGVDEFPTTFVTGALMLVDADLLRGGLRFDTRFFLYGEDLDLCCEVRARGRELWVSRRAIVRHVGGGSMLDEPMLATGLRPTQLYRMTESKALFARKRLSWLQRAVFVVLAFVVKPLIGVVTTRSTGFLRLYYAGLLAGFSVPLAEGTAASQGGPSRE